MALSWNEIKERAVAFSKEWADTVNEDAEAKPFLVDFFNVFGISRKKVATFEERVKKIDDSDGYIDLLWRGTLLVEMKSKGRNLDKAYQQARDYLQTLKQSDLPKYILVSDFERFRLYDLEEDSQTDFLLKDFVKNVQHFGFIAGYHKKRDYGREDPVNIEAAERLGKLHDQMKATGYDEHALEVYLVRLLFCLFADDTTIFEKETFREFIELKTSEDGSDLAARLNELFFILNTPKEKRLNNLDEQLDAFPYVNGKLFEETLPPASFTSEMRKSLLHCCQLDWSKISPAIFGSMFQSVMNPKERRNLGAHYTSEKNILKLIQPLFLDDLRKEFEDVKGNRNKLIKFHEKISMLRFLDPACGCGNFLVISYRELRLLEIEIIKVLQKGQQVFDVDDLVKLNVDRFYGIEIEEFPAQIAQVALWLMDHQMNMAVSQEFGDYFIRLPLRKSPVIVQGNALRMDWQSLIDPIPWEKKEQMFDFIFGNPPFVGTAYQSIEQKSDINGLMGGSKSSGMLDYVAGWYIIAANYIQRNQTKVAFVSTSSITQGEQVGILWQHLYSKFNVKIHFAHRTFKWSNEGRNNAGVHVVIIGFGFYESNRKIIYEYESVNSDSHENLVKNINPYIVDANNVWLPSVINPICKSPKMQSGSAARDGGHLILSDDDKNKIISNEPEANRFIRRFISGDDIINNIVRWCIWLKDVPSEQFRNIKSFHNRFTNVKDFRERSTRVGTKKMANLPYLFAEERQPNEDFLIIPKVSSEYRKYIPIAYLSKDYIVSDKTFIIPNANFFHFGVLTSKMHMTWMKFTCGRLESRFSYSNTIVYNNFPWPESPTEKQTKAVEAAVQKVLDTRKEFPGSSLADLYDPLTMPSALVKAHQELDKAVDLCYRSQPFTTEARRMEFLFELYEKYTAGLFAEGRKKEGKKRKAKA